MLRFALRGIFVILVNPWALAAVPALAQDQLPTLEIRAKAENLAGVAQSASEGVVSGERLAQVPLMRPAEALEMVPGMLVTQHAGDGKANQYFLRGFNLDHGTDFATFVDGVPVNMPTHAHGQGYSDLNFLIPELVQQIRYRKGPYFAEDGDFSSAGSARLDYRRTLDQGLAQLTLGPHGYARTLLADSIQRTEGVWLYGLELARQDGPWTVPEGLRKQNAVLRYSEGSAHSGWSVTAMVYQARWTSTDQIPQRALDQGLLGRFDSLDPTSGGQTQRTSLSAQWADVQAGTQRKTQVWLLQSALDLWSDFTYRLDDPIQGDQFQQSERRTAMGLNHSRSWGDVWWGHEVRNQWGLQTRTDRLAPVGLYATAQRQRLGTLREDQVNQHSLGLWADSEWRWTDWLRSVLGLRADAYRFDVRSSLPANSGEASDQKVSPRLSLVFGAWQGAEFYINWGQGFHSNDARGTTIRVDPLDPAQAVGRVNPLVRTRGQELGWRMQWQPGWRTGLALWQLRMDSELLFAGDAGTTEPSRPSLRRGLEWTNFFKLTPHWALDADWSWSQARFTDGGAEGPYVPGAATFTANLGLTWDSLGPWSGALRLRYWGSRALTEDDLSRSAPAAWLNWRMAYRSGPRDEWTLTIYNLLNRPASDIEYAYVSRLAGESAEGVRDRHLHPAEPRTLRLSWQHWF